MRIAKRGAVVTLLTLCALIGMGNAKAVNTETSTPASEPIVFTQVESTSSFGVYLDMNDTIQKITTVEVNDHVNTLTVQTAVAPNGAYVGVVPNFDTIAGTDLHIYDVQSEQEIVTIEDRIASVAWLPTSNEFAYGKLTDQGAEIYMSTIEGETTLLTSIEEATEIELLGWSNDGNTLYFVHGSHLTGFPVPTLVQFDLTTQTSQDMFVSQKGNYYNDFRLLNTSVGEYISFIRSDEFWMCSASEELVLATTDGSIVAEHVVAEQAVSQSVWHPDGKQVAFAARACPSKDQKVSKTRISEGVFVVDTTNGQEEQIVTTALVDYDLSDFSGDDLIVTSKQHGNHQLDTTAPAIDTLPTTTLPSLSDNLQSDATIQEQSNWVPYVHQFLSTPEWFNGAWACGPTSAVMTVAHYRLPPHPISAHGQENDYGFYVPEIYTYNGTTFDWAYPDPNGNTAWGAYGYIVGDPGLAYWSLITDYLNLHNVGVEVANPDVGAQWIKDRINEGKVVIASGNVFGQGHLIVIRGYADDGTFIVNDPSGDGTQPEWGQHMNGENARYTWDQIAPAYFWAVAR